MKTDGRVLLDPTPGFFGRLKSMASPGGGSAGLREKVTEITILSKGWIADQCHWSG